MVSLARRTRALVIAGLVLLAPLCFGGPSAAAPPPASFFGVYTEDPLGRELDEQVAIMRDQRAAGAGLVRIPLDWPTVEPARGTSDWRIYDSVVDASARAGIDLLPTLKNAPPWATSRPAGDMSRGDFPPQNPFEFGRFAQAAVRRYGPNGTFWANNPTTPYRPIRAWQVWNEPNIPYFWPSGPNPAAYTNLLIATAIFIRAADPDAIVVTAGITSSVMGIPIGSFVRGMYRAGAKGHFDVLGIHPYGGDAQSSIATLESARTAMDDAGDHSPIWATELAWASDGEGSRFTSDEQGQAARLASFLRAATAQRAALRLGAVVYYNWRDSESSVTGPGAWPARSGLLRRDGSPKPAYFAFHDAALDLSSPPRHETPGGASADDAEPATGNPATDDAGEPAADPPADPPRLRLPGSRRIRVRGDGSIVVSAWCALSACHGMLRLTRNGRTVAQRRLAMAAGARERLRLPLTRHGWRLLGRMRSVVVHPGTRGLVLARPRALRILPPPGWRG